MPRPTRTRTSLPGHTKAAKLDSPSTSSRTIATPDALDDSYMMDPAEMAPMQAPKVIEDTTSYTSPFLPESEALKATEESNIVSGKRKTKAEKAQAKRQHLLDQINARSEPYSKSHARRVKRAARPSANLVTSLSDVHDVLPEIEPEYTFENDEDDDGSGVVVEDDSMGEGKVSGTGGKGKEKLTAKKRQRVLSSESLRLPAILANSHFSASPFATIRQHTINTVASQKAALPSSTTNARGKKGKKVGNRS